MKTLNASGADSDFTHDYPTVEEVVERSRVRLESPEKVSSHGSLRFGASFIFFVVVLAVLIMIFVPWVQNVRGAGRVIAYAPDERQQSLTAPVDGLISKWFVLEGTRVKKGESDRRCGGYRPGYPFASRARTCGPAT